MARKVYYPRGVCSRQIIIETDGDIIESVQFVGGCGGNTAGISKLVAGRPVQEVADLLAGVPCGYRPTSCPDQLSRALKEIIRQ